MKNFINKILFAIAGVFMVLSNLFSPSTANAFNGQNTSENLSGLTKHAFNSFNGNNFDPNNFDPNNFEMDRATGEVKRKEVNPAQLGQGGQFTIQIVNAQATSVTVELFQFIKSITTANNANVSALNPFTALDVAAANANSLVFFDRSGNLVYRNAAPADCTISCKQIPYVALFKASGLFPMIIDRIRLNVTTDTQIDQDIVHVTSSFLGLIKRNSISPRSFFAPNQFQSKTIDIVAACDITAEKGLEIVVLAAETITLNIYLRAFNKPTV